MAEEVADLTGSQIIIKKLLENMSDGMLKSYLNAMLPSVVSFFWSVVLAIAVYLLGVRIIRLMIALLKKPMEKRDVELGVITFTESLVRILCYGLLVIIILTLFGVSTSSIAAAIASAGLAIGLALQGALSNFAGGVLILILKPFVVGDYIIEDTHRNEGIVLAISVFYTRLRTIDNKIIVIPNGILANSSLVNATMSDKRMVQLVVPIGYHDDIKKAKGILKKIVDTEEYRLAQEEEQIYVDELGESAVHLGLRFWVPTDKYWEARWRTIEQIKLCFDAEGITIPFDQIDVHVIKETDE